MVVYSVQQVPIERTFALRQAVLRPHLPRPEAFVMAGDGAPATVAFGATTEAGDVLSVARLSVEAPPFDPGRPGWRLRGMATRPEVRNQGIGGAVLRAAIAHVAAHGGGVLWCNARMPAANLYRRAGFATWGDPWEDRDIGPHVVMWREVHAAERRSAGDGPLTPSDRGGRALPGRGPGSPGPGSRARR